METLRISIFVLCLVGIFILSGLYLGVHAMYRRGTRRYERVLDHTYCERFEQRTVVAKSVHPQLAQMIRRSKSVVDQVRKRATNGPETTEALNRVSEWLAGAAGESDRALRSLESGPVRALNGAYTARREHVGTKTNSHNDR
jgi:hypothetical protein